jgi:acetylglutamate kinase
MKERFPFRDLFLPLRTKVQEMEKLTLIKVGGKIVEEENALNNLLHDFSKIEGAKVLVHGGGRLATKMAEQLGIESKMVDGRRITDAETLRIVTMVYAGLVNKNIVARLQALGVNAIGLTGADMNIMRSEKRPVKTIDYGFAGDVKEVNTEALAMILKNGYMPVLSPLTHDKKGNLLNTNADTIAGETAKALAGQYDVTLIFCFEKSGVLLDEQDDNSMIPRIDREIFEEYKINGIIRGGMIPKLENSFQAIKVGVKQVIITQASEIGKNKGTHISNNHTPPT